MSHRYRVFLWGWSVISHQKNSRFEWHNTSVSSFLIGYRIISTRKGNVQHAWSILWAMHCGFICTPSNDLLSDFSIIFSSARNPFNPPQQILVLRWFLTFCDIQDLHYIIDYLSWTICLDIEQLPTLSIGLWNDGFPQSNIADRFIKGNLRQKLSAARLAWRSIDACSICVREYQTRKRRGVRNTKQRCRHRPANLISRPAIWQTLGLIQCVKCDPQRKLM